MTVTAEIVLLNIIPKDEHSKWPIEADELIRKILSDGRSVYQHRAFVCRSKFAFCLSNTFWVTNVQGMEHLESTDEKIQWTPIFEVKEKINPYAEKYSKHSEYLVKLCQKTTTLDKSCYQNLMRYVSRPELDSTRLDSTQDKIVPETNEKHQITEVWPKLFKNRNAFFDLDVINIDVRITEIYNPSHFYVQLVKFDSQLKYLEDSLKIEYDNFKKKLKKNGCPSFEPELNQICVLKYNEQQVCRVQYLGNNYVNFVDYGSEVEVEPGSNLAPISKKSLDLLPFQAIKCSLAYVEPNEGSDDYTDQAIELFQTYLDQSVLVNNPEKISNGHYKVELSLPETYEIIGVTLAQSLLFKYTRDIIDSRAFDMNDISQALPSLSDNEEKNKSNPFKTDPNNKSEKDKRLAEVDVIQNLSSNSGERKALFIPKVPHDMPSLTISTGEIPKSKLPDNVTWYQGSKLNTYFKVNFNGIEVIPSRVYIQITAETLSVSYLDVSYDEFSNEIFTLFEIPQQLLFSDVIPNATKVTFSANGFQICLKKAKSMFWPKPFLDSNTGEPIKMPWLKHFVDEISSSDEEETEYVENGKDDFQEPRKFLYGIKNVESTDDNDSNDEVASLSGESSDIDD